MPGDMLAPVKVLKRKGLQLQSALSLAIKQLTAKTLGLLLPFNSFKAVIQMQTLKTLLLVSHRWMDHSKT